MGLRFYSAYKTFTQCRDNLDKLRDGVGADRVLLALEYVWGHFGWLFHFDQDAEGRLRRVDEIPPSDESWIAQLIRAEDPPLSVWEYVPEGLFRTKLRRAF